VLSVVAQQVRGGPGMLGPRVHWARLAGRNLLASAEWGPAIGVEGLPVVAQLVGLAWRCQDPWPSGTVCCCMLVGERGAAFCWGVHM